MFITILNRSRILSILIIAIFFLLLALSLGISITDIINSNLSLQLLLSDLAASFLRVTIISLVAWACGILGGYLLHNSIGLNSLILPLINFIRHISPFSWLPFAIIWFGLGELSVSFIMFITLFFPTLIAASDQFSNIPQQFIDEGNVSGASALQMLLKVKLPLAMPSLASLFRIIWALGWTVVIAAEMLGVTKGMGFRLLDLRYLLRYPEMLIYLLVMGFVGILIDTILKRILTIYIQKYC
ncbi:MAG: ABC transporter permease subunit [Candidatus Cloacimonetes bacterium]|nr:ABC transporter permease subunit [Candidatus Cloacimonadota bacterium]